MYAAHMQGMFSVAVSDFVQRIDVWNKHGIKDVYFLNFINLFGILTQIFFLFAVGKNNQISWSQNFEIK